jgi:hypothetical protein
MAKATNTTAQSGNRKKNKQPQQNELELFLFEPPEPVRQRKWNTTRFHVRKYDTNYIKTLDVHLSIRVAEETSIRIIESLNRLFEKKLRKFLAGYDNRIQLMYTTTNLDETESTSAADITVPTPPTQRTQKRYLVPVGEWYDSSFYLITPYQMTDTGVLLYQDKKSKEQLRQEIEWQLVLASESIFEIANVASKLWLNDELVANTRPRAQERLFDAKKSIGTTATADETHRALI